MIQFFVGFILLCVCLWLAVKLWRYLLVAVAAAIVIAGGLMWREEYLIDARTRPEATAHPHPRLARFPAPAPAGSCHQGIAQPGC
jgi:uncharacterized membrane protein